MSLLVRRTLVITVLALAAASPAAGQTEADNLRSVALRAKERDWHVRISTAEGAQDGRVTRVRPDTINLVGAQIAIADVSAVERRLKEGGGAGIGALVGGVAIGLLGLAASSMCDRDCTGSAVILTGGGIMIGGVFGGLAGNAVAPARERWEPLWPSSTPQR